MEVKRKRLTLDLDPTLQRKLKVIAALKGVTMRGYCQTAIDNALAQDEASGLIVASASESDAERFAKLRQKYFGGKTLPGNGADFIREAREMRAAQLEEVM